MLVSFHEAEGKRKNSVLDTMVMWCLWDLQVGGWLWGLRLGLEVVRHHECTESRCGDWHGCSHSGAEDIFWYTSLNTVKEGESYPKCEKTWPYSGSSISETKGRKFQEEEGRKRGKSGECLIVFAFNLICLWLIQGAGLHFIQNAMKVVFRESLHSFFCMYLNTCLKRDWKETH